MVENNYSLLIKKLIKACVQKDASAFAALFNNDGKLQLDQDTQIDKSQIEQVTKNYFASLVFIDIKVHSTAINQAEKKAFIEWTWSDYNQAQTEHHHRNNVIVLEFKDDLVYRWREYKN